MRARGGRGTKPWPRTRYAWERGARPGNESEGSRVGARKLVLSMKEISTPTMSLLAVERGAGWPSWASEIHSRAANVAVEVQLPHETLADFSERVLRRLAKIDEEGLRLTAAGYACALEVDPESEVTRGARLGVCESLLNQLATTDASRESLTAGDAGQLVVGGGPWATTGAAGKAREALIALWGDLSCHASGRLVSLRFDDAPAERPPAVSPGSIASRARQSASAPSTHRAFASHAGSGASTSGVHRAVGPALRDRFPEDMDERIA